MANEEHLRIFRSGIEAWNRWRDDDRSVIPDLSELVDKRACLNFFNLDYADLTGSYLVEAQLAQTRIRWARLQNANLGFAFARQANLSFSDLSGADLRVANFSGADLAGAKLNGANLSNSVFAGANLSGCSLTGADLTDADLSAANLRLANLTRARLRNANLSDVNLTGAQLQEADMSGSRLIEAKLTAAKLESADLSGANLMGATFVQTDLRRANLSNASVYGLSAWDAILEDANQTNLLITPIEGPRITADNLALAQFLYLLLNNANIRDAIDTIASKVVLILGRFSDERKVVLDAMREALRQRNYRPILFDFVKPSSRNTTETIHTLAHMARFVIADITDAKSIPQELQAIVPGLPSVPVAPVILGSQKEYGMFDDFRQYRSVLELVEYESQEQLLKILELAIIEPAESKVRDLRRSA